MKRTLLLPFFAIASILSFGQSQNALDFDGTDDYVSVPNASGSLTSATGISMSCWVYLTNTAPSFPNFDHIIGFRNESNFDFYMLQLSSTNIEARFRNSSGTTYDVLATNVVTTNSWQHYVMTWNGIKLKFFHNGVMVGSVTAVGSITNANVPFQIGRGDFGTTNYMLNGKVDEVTLWSKALGNAEIACLHANALNPDTADLELYFKCNEGIAAGTNTGLTVLPNSVAAGTNGTLNYFSLSGASSNWVAGITNYTTDSMEMCRGEIDSINGVFIDTAGIYEVYYSTADGCDSLVLLEVQEKDTIDLTIIVILSVPPTFGMVSGYDSYQWLQCQGGGYQIIQGANNKNFAPSENGEYACAIENDGCRDTTDCFPVMGIGINESDQDDIVLFPNPATEIVYLEGVSSGTRVEIYSIDGRMIDHQEYKGAIDLRDLSSGNYFIKVQEHTIRLLKL